MASFTVNEAGTAQARALIDARQIVLRSRWTEVQPAAGDENAFLESHTWDEYGNGSLPAHEVAALLDGRCDWPTPRRNGRPSTPEWWASAIGRRSCSNTLPPASTLASWPGGCSCPTAPWRTI